MLIPEYTLECTPNCSLRLGTIWGEKATVALLEKKSYRAICALAALDHYKLNTATLQRHKRHISLKPVEETVRGITPSNIEILQEIIQKGFENKKNWRPTISDTMKAMDMWFKLTSGNPFDELLDTLASAGIGEENDEAIGSPSGVESPDVDLGDGFEDDGSGEEVSEAVKSGPGDNSRQDFEE